MSNSFHPGQFLKEELKTRDIKIKDFSKKLLISNVQLSRILNGHNRLTPDIAVKLEKIFKISAEYWYKMQSNYDLQEARKTITDYEG